MVVATKKKMVGCGHASCVGKGGCTASLVPKGKKVGKGQAPPPDGMPPKKPRGAMPLPGAKVSRRHRPPMNKKPPGGGLGGPMAAMKPPMPPMGGMPGPAGPGGMPPMGGGAPMGPPMLPGAGAGGAPGMPPPRPPMPGMGQARKKSAKKAPAKGKKK